MLLWFTSFMTDIVYFSGTDYGHQDAVIGFIFFRFPPSLLLGGARGRFSDRALAGTAS